MEIVVLLAENMSRIHNLNAVIKTCAAASAAQTAFLVLMNSALPPAAITSIIMSKSSAKRDRRALS